jgi:lipopolysaccharide export system permease protein
MQAVNFLKFVTEDGHNLQVYFSYTLLNFPKIIHRIIPFIFFIALFQQISNYENRNELLIFWTHGINKIQFVNVVILFSLIIGFFQILLGSYISPLGQKEARKFLKESNIDYFPSLIKEGKFIDTVSNLTIFIDTQDENGIYKNIFIKEQFKNENKTLEDDTEFKSQIIYANKGILINQQNRRYFKLFEGKFINNNNGKVSNFSFDQIDFDLSKYVSKTTTHPKVQETKSLLLLKCLKTFFKDNKNFKEGYFICDKRSISAVKQEFFKRFYQPIYIPLVALICCLLIFKSKESHNFRSFKIVLLLINFFILIISETFLRYSGYSEIGLLIFILFPLFFFLLFYFSLIVKLKYKS